ncbi:cupin domain-containing protein [uncultured Sphingomonas sp.]|uniref:cupin domain-containing protein n=1 Tax=uncultured Sphingomonas sp. TaxID=158754 RepID=UPI0035C9B147
MKYARSVVAEAAWVEGPHPGLRYHDLKLGTASDGQIGARHFAADRADRSARWDTEDEVTFALLYVMAGSIAFGAGKDAIRLERDDCAYQDVFSGDTPAAWSENFQAFEVTVPARGAAVPPFETLRFAPGGLPTGVHPMGPDVFKPDGGPRTFFIYRDLGSAEATGGRVHIHVVRAIGAMDGGTGWHVHSMSQMFYVIAGWVDIAVDGEPPLRMTAGDAMCLAQGMRHDVVTFSPDYVVFEVCLPADYSTVATPAPDLAGAGR